MSLYMFFLFVTVKLSLQSIINPTEFTDLIFIFAILTIQNLEINSKTHFNFIFNKNLTFIL